MDVIHSLNTHTTDVCLIREMFHLKAMDIEVCEYMYVLTSWKETDHTSNNQKIHKYHEGDY